MDFGHLKKNYPKNIRKKLLNIAGKTGLGVLKITSKKLVQKTAEATGQFIGNKIAGKIGKAKLISEINLRNIEETVIPPEKNY